MAASRPNAPFVLYREQRITYAAANCIVNAHAWAYTSLGLRAGDVVALFMENRPEYVWHVLAMAKLGIVPALVNANAVGQLLVDAIRIAGARHIVIGSELLAAFEPVRARLAGIPVDIDADPDAPPPQVEQTWQDRRQCVEAVNPPTTGARSLNELFAYVYTSGTTGAPKAALVRHRRVSLPAHVWGGFVWRFRQNDVVYVCLPLYHASGMFLGVGSAITFGATIAIARRFSAAAFWNDCRQYDATCAVYIGELCRYLMNAPPSALDRTHKVRIFSGSGMRSDIWEGFQRRFGIERLVEFYASTEGNVAAINFGNVVGAVGKLAPGQTIAKWDASRRDFVRDSDGHLVRSAPGEPGILLGRIAATAAFDGYKDREATARKVVRDAFKPGDAWFDTGDLFRTDAKRYLYFLDRMGDTFRWKGENVSTYEVEQQMARWDPVDEVSVYGVRVEGTEGRAGMVALSLKEGVAFQPCALRAHVDAVLPSYARPLFVRVVGAMRTTATFKVQKAELQKEGFDPSAIDEPLYFRNPASGEYVPLDAHVYAGIVAGSIRV